MENLTVAFIGHRDFETTFDLIVDMNNLFYDLVVRRGIRRFIFGSNSKFDAMCFRHMQDYFDIYHDIWFDNIRAEDEAPDILTGLILRAKYLRSEYPPEVRVSRSKYVTRNEIMIDRCDILVTYYDENYVNKRGAKGLTAIAVAYAEKNNKEIINLFKPTQINKV